MVSHATELMEPVQNACRDGKIISAANVSRLFENANQNEWRALL